jgi:hypothetical protein
MPPFAVKVVGKVKISEIMKSISVNKWVRVGALCAAIVVLVSTGGMAQAAEGRSTTDDLAALYNEHQRVLTLRDACIAVQPERKGEFSSAYQDWMHRHVRIVDDLENRFAAVIKRASKDQADYTRNYGKYQSEVMQLREENKKALLADKEKLTVQCAELPAYLRHPKSDIPTLLPAEFKRLYRVR